MIDQLPLSALTTPGGIIVAGALVRQVIEVLKHSLLPWLDDGNERKGVVIVAALIYVAWLAAYGQDLATDGWAALYGFLAVSATSIGVNEAVDAARDQVSKNVVKSLTERPEIVAAGAGSARTQGDVQEVSVPLEGGPDLDLRVAGGEVLDLDAEQPADPARGFVPVG
jgi:hypothetical protein